MKAAGSRLLSLLKGESGQTLPLMMLASGLFIAMGGITIDVGRAFIVKRDLQGATDAAALAGAYAMSLPTATSSSVKALVSSYGSTSTGQNINPMLQSVTVSTTLSCLTTVANWGVYCSSSTTGDNALQVVQTGTIKTLFIQILSVFGVTSAKTLTVKAVSTAAMRGSANAQYNVAILIDATASMGSQDTDASCNNTRIYCALSGVQTLLKALSPCTAASVVSH